MRAKYFTKRADEIKVGDYIVRYFGDTSRKVLDIYASVTVYSFKVEDLDYEPSWLWYEEVTCENKMNPKTYDAIQFMIGNAKSYSGVYDVKVIYDNLLKQWLLDCGEFSLVLDKETALEIVEEISNPMF